MRKMIVLLMAAGVLLGVFGVVLAQDATQEAPMDSENVTCTLNFEATVYQGPETELSLVGDLTLSVDPTGAAEGSLVTSDTGAEYPVVGQVNGRAINLAFDLGDDVYIFGLGTAFEPIGAGNCGKALGGPFVGPSPDDTGTWLAGSAVKPEATEAAS